MNKLRWNGLVLAVLIAVAGTLGPMAKPSIHLAEQQQRIDLESLFPKTIGAWQLDTRQPVGIVSPDVAAMLQKLYAQTLSRTYVGTDGTRIMLSVAYGGDQSDATRTHRPDVCYPAQGFQVLSNNSSKVNLPSGELPVRHMVAKQGARVEPVTFWFTVGEYTAVTGQDQKLMQLKYGFRGIVPDGMLVRVSTIDNDEAAAFKVQAQFIADLKQAMDASGQPRVFGRKLSS